MHAMFTNSLQFYYVMLLSVVGVLVCAATKPTNIFLYSSAGNTHRDNTSLDNYPVICSFPVAALGTPKHSSTLLPLCTQHIVL